LIFAVGLHRRMTESAVAEGRLNDRRLVTSLAKGLTGVIIDALDAGRRDLANEAAEICRKMPIGIGRRLRLLMYQLLAFLPRGAFPALWQAWLKIRRAVFEIPRRELSRLDGALRVEKRNP
jgi:hypothetical protein